VSLSEKEENATKEVLDVKKLVGKAENEPKQLPQNLNI
jgi:hypothetical protein